MFPSPGDEIYTNEAGEPTGWGKPDEGPPYCDICGVNHYGECAEDRDADDERDSPEDILRSISDSEKAEATALGVSEEELEAKLYTPEDQRRFLYPSMTVHIFATSGEAYDALYSQCHDNIKDGHVLWIVSQDQVAILCGAWPISLRSPEREDAVFHYLDGKTWDDFAKGRYKIVADMARNLYKEA